MKNTPETLEVKSFVAKSCPIVAVDVRTGVARLRAA